MDIHIQRPDGARIRFPVTPGKLTVTDRGRNTAVSLIDNSQLSILGGTGLREIAFDAMLPNRRYPFAVYDDGTFRPAQEYLSFVRELRALRAPFRLVIGDNTGGRSFRVSLEDCVITEDASLGGDVLLSLKLREVRDGVLKIAKPDQPAAPAQPREPPAAPKPGTYTVQKGDTLWAVAKRFLGDGSRWPEIHALNRDKVTNPNLIYAGQVLTLP